MDIQCSTTLPEQARPYPAVFDVQYVPVWGGSGSLTKAMATDATIMMSLKGK